MTGVALWRGSKPNAGGVKTSCGRAQHFDDVLWCFSVCLCLSLANEWLDIPSMYEVMVSTGFSWRCSNRKIGGTCYWTEM